MKIRYVLTRTDYIRGTLRAAVFNKPVMIYLGVFSTVMVGLSLRTEYHRGASVSYLVFAGLFQMDAIALLMAFGMVVIGCLTLCLGKGTGVVCEHEMEAVDAGLVERTEFNETCHRWKGVTRVRTTPGYYFVRVNETGGSYHVIPRLRRPLEGDVEAFVAEIRVRCSATKPTGPT